MYKDITIRRLHGCVWLFSALMITSLAQAQVERPFDERAGFNVNGDIEMVGNALLTCAAGGSPACADVQAGTVSGHNGSRDMIYINVDPGAGFANSSSADLSLPPGSTVLYAALYWGGRADPADGDRGSIQLRVPGSAVYQPVSADTLDTITSQGDTGRRPYLAFADVTAAVEAAGSGTYFVGDLTASDGSGDGLGLYGGWSLVVIYEDMAQSFRRLALFDGAAVVSGSNSVTVNVSGLLTPSVGAFDTFMGALVWEGDTDFTGDQFLLEGVQLSDAQNPPDNFWNSSITRLGTRFDAKNPDFVNLLAVDLDYVDASGILANSATSAELEFVTDGDVHFPHALTFAVDLFAPDLVSSFTKDAVDVNGGELFPGDIIEYTITYENTGNDGAINVILTDPIPANTSYVPETMEILTNAAGAPTGPQTDAPGDDVADFDGIANEVVFRLGDGADTVNGGLVPPGETATVRFQVQVDDNVNVSGETILNTATVNYASQTVPSQEFSGDAEAELTVVDLADLSVAKSVNDATPLIGDNVIFTIVVTNGGPADATGIEVLDTLPSGYSFVNATASQGVYDDGTGVWAVGDLTAGQDVTLEIEVTVLETGDYLNTASVSGDQEDPDEENNEGEEGTDPVADPSLDLVKSADPATYDQVGDTIEYSFTVENTGNMTLFDVAVNDPLLGGAVACIPDTLAPGEVANCGPVNYQVTQADIDNGEIVNTAEADAEDVNQTPVSDQDTVGVSGPEHAPALELVKSADPDGYDQPGDEIDYSFTVENTGNVTLDDVSVDDPLLGGAVACAPTTLAPGEIAVCGPVSYVVTQQDVDNGSVVNAATAGALDPEQNPVGDEDENEVTGPEHAPALEVVKTLTDAPDPIVVGSILEYTVIATNTGNVTLDPLEVSDDLITPDSNSCPAVAPGDSCELVGTYEVTQADVDAGQIVNTGTGTGTPPPTDQNPEPEPISEEEEVTTEVEQNPDLSLDKVLDSAEPEPVGLGTVLSYTVTATNTGDVTLSDVVVSDDLITPDSITCATLSPGETCVLSGTYTVTEADVIAGEVLNVATAVGEDTTGTPVPEITTNLVTPVELQLGPAFPIPTMSRPALAVLILLLAGLALPVLRARA